MVRKDLIKAVSKRAGCTQKIAESVIDAYADVVADVLTNDKTERIDFGWIGDFRVRHIKERTGVTNLHTRREYAKPAHDKLIFKLGKYGLSLFDDDNEDDESEGED